MCSPQETFVISQLRKEARYVVSLSHLLLKRSIRQFLILFHRSFLVLLQESCARMLLFRGADKNSHNFANQTPYQVAVIAGNLEIADIIKMHSFSDVGG